MAQFWQKTNEITELNKVESYGTTLKENKVRGLSWVLDKVKKGLNL